MKPWFHTTKDDASLYDAAVLTTFVMLGALQLLIVMVYVFSFIPITLAPFIKDLPLKLQQTILPEREIFFYRVFIAAAIAAQCAAGWVMYSKERSRRSWKSLKGLIIVQSFWLLMELFAAFKMYAYEGPVWARALLYVSFAGAVLTAVFWPEMERGILKIREGMMEKQSTAARWVDFGIPVLLVLFLWIPDVERALSRVFVWEQFRNLDQAFMLPGLAYLKGLVLNRDVAAPQGVGVAVLVSRLAQMVGGFDHAHVLQVLMGMAILYYAALYAFVRNWLGNAFVAAFVVLMAVKSQIFHNGISPLVWTSPQDTPVRHWLDLPVLFLFLQHARTGKPSYLKWTAVGVGLALAYNLSLGLSLLAALYVYTAWLLIVPEQRAVIAPSYKAQRRLVLYGILPFVVMPAVLFLLQGNAVLHAAYWSHLIEPLKEAMQGVGALPIYACLRERQFFAFFLGFVIPLIYAVTLMAMAGRCSLKKATGTDLFIVPVCVYGLAMYMHYPAHASTSHYYAVSMPLFLVIGFWAWRMTACLSAAKAVSVSWGLALFALAALMTNTLFVYYPNVLDIARLDPSVEKGMYRTQSRFDMDAAMIAQLTPAASQVPVLASFEASILMQAGRQPFFYDAPLVSSHRMDEPVFAGTSLLTKARVERTVRQIEVRAPEYIFIEKGLLAPLSPQFEAYYPGVAALIKFISASYAPEVQGQYLTALRKK